MCLFTTVSLEAAVCGEITRSQLHLPEGDQLVGRLEHLPEHNCNLNANFLPRDIFLQRLDSYGVVVTLELLEFG